MQTLKKKDIKNYKPISKPELEEVNDLVEVEELEEEVEELDEFVNGMGAAISGDEKNVNNSEIKTAPQNTTDQFAQTAIQPNRYLFNVDATGGKVNGMTSEAINKIAKDKMLSLLEDMTGPQLSSSKGITDFNNNDISDINELPSNVARKLTDLVDTVFKNNLQGEQINIILQYVNTKLKGNAQ